MTEHQIQDSDRAKPELTPWGAGVSGFGRVLGWLALVPIYGYRLFISPLFPPMCRYEPTCSAYAVEAVKIHGPLRGCWLAARRIGRCHPVEWLGGGSGFDPVPAPKAKPKRPS